LEHPTQLCPACNQTNRRFAAGTGLAQQVIAHVGAFFARQDPAHLRRTFDRHAGAGAAAGGQPAIVRERLRAALEELRVLVLDDTVDELFATMDTDGDDAVDIDEFTAAVARPSRIEQWTDGIAVDRLLASALSPVVLAHAGGGGGNGAVSCGDVMRALSRCVEISRDALKMDCRATESLNLREHLPGVANYSRQAVAADITREGGGGWAKWSGQRILRGVRRCREARRPLQARLPERCD
jgi:hypothetical protein